MKVTYYFPAHVSYFKKNYTQDRVDQAVLVFSSLFKPDKLGEIPEEFVFLTEPGKEADIGFKFDSTGMNPSDEKTKERWHENTTKLAKSAYDSYFNEIHSFVKGTKNQINQKTGIALVNPYER